MNRTIRLVFERETPGAVLYQEVDLNGKRLTNDADGALVRTLYLRKKQLNGKIPQILAITIVEAVQ